MALQAISAGSGLAIVLESFAQPFLERGAAVAPVPDRLAIRPAHFLVERDGGERRDEVRAFADWICTLFQGPRP